MKPKRNPAYAKAKRVLLLVNPAAFNMTCSYFGFLPDGREFHAQPCGRKGWLEVIATSDSKARVPEGSMSVWKRLATDQRFLVKNPCVCTPHRPTAQTANVTPGLPLA